MEQHPILLQQSARWLPADMDTPISLFRGMAANGCGILLESAEVDGRWGRYSVLLCDVALVLSCREGRLKVEVRDEKVEPLRELDGSDCIEGLRTLMRRVTLLPPENFQDLPPITRGLYGYFGYGLAALFSERLARVMPKEEAEFSLILPRTCLLFDHLYNRLCQISLDGHKTLVSGRSIPDTGREQFQAHITSNPDERGYKEQVERIKTWLGLGEAIQVVPSVRFSCPFEGDVFELYRKMRRFNASPYMFFMRMPGITLFGSSPEVMVRCTAGRVTLSPIAGTRRRGKDEREDDFLAGELLNDPKERAEHVMLVDLGRNDLGRIARPGSVNVESLMQIERFSHVMHITSSVAADLNEGLDAMDVLAATFPAGTVSGAPKIRAMELIRECEGSSRGPYAGCIGWIGLDKESVNLDMGITIRSMWLRDRTLFWQAGGGIVHDSDPELEWKEVCNKSAIMRLVLETKDEEYVSAHR